MTDPISISVNLFKLGSTEENDLSDFIETLYQDCFDNMNNMKSLVRFIHENPKTLRGLPHNILLRIMQNHLDIITEHVKQPDKMVIWGSC
jgi:hypothetical protein